MEIILVYRLLFGVVFTAACFLLTMHLCMRKGWPVGVGILLGLLCCQPFGLIVAACLPWSSQGKEAAAREVETALELAEASQTRPCPNCGRVNSVASRVCPRCETRLGPWDAC